MPAPPDGDTTRGPTAGSRPPTTGNPAARAGFRSAVLISPFPHRVSGPRPALRRPGHVRCTLFRRNCVARPRWRGVMAKCEVCGNDYDKAFTVTMNGQPHTFDSFECAVHALAPTCAHCGCQVVGHGVEK